MQRRGIAWFILVFAGMIVFSLNGPHADSEHSDAPFQSPVNLMAEVDATLRQAKSEGKLALFALGANWCHDSRGFVAKLDHPDVKAVIADHYVSQLVNVGFYNEGFEVAARFGRPTLYATPTIIVVDPAEEKQINEDTMHIWRSAADLPVEAAVADLKAVARRGAQPLTDVQKAGLADIKAFEQRVSARITQGFAVVGPELAKDEAGADSRLSEVWGPLSRLRGQFQKDVIRLRAQVMAHQGAGPLDLTFPTYAPLPWEDAALGQD